MWTGYNIAPVMKRVYLLPALLVVIVTLLGLNRAAAKLSLLTAAPSVLQPQLAATPVGTPNYLPFIAGVVPTSESLPDLTIVQMRIELETGGSCDYMSTQLGVRVWFRNAGNADAGPFVIEINGELYDVTQGLTAGTTGTRWSSAFHTFPEANTMFIDADDQVIESDETNNQRAEQLPVPTLPAPCTPVP